MNDSNGETLPSIIKVNPRHKQFVVVLLLGILVLGVALHLTLRPYLENWIDVYVEELPQKSREELGSDYQFFTVLVSLGLMIPMAVLGTGFLYQGYRVHCSGQYPYPRMMILRDTLLETGVNAKRWVWRFVLVGGGALIVGCVVSWFVYVTLMQLLLSGNIS